MSNFLLDREFSLSYPAGRAPGIDPRHPASQGLIVSAIPAAGGNCFNLATGHNGVLSSTAGATTLTYTQFATLGPCIDFSSATTVSNFVSFSGLPNTITSATIAVFYATNNTSNSPWLLQYSNTTSAGISMFIGSPGTFNGATIQTGVNNTALGLPVAATLTPYFTAFSMKGGFCNLVHVNLRTGSTQTNRVSVANFTATAGSSVTIGNTLAHNGSLAVGVIGPSMISTAYLSKQDMAKWGQAPFDFWYPLGDSLMYEIN